MSKQPKVETLRKKIDQLDRQLMVTFLKRAKVVRSIQKLKNKNRLPVEDLKREKAIIDGLIKKYSSLDAQFVKQIYKTVFTFAKKDRTLNRRIKIKIGP